MISSRERPDTPNFVAEWAQVKGISLNERRLAEHVKPKKLKHIIKNPKKTR